MGPMLLLLSRSFWCLPGIPLATWMQTCVEAPWGMAKKPLAALRQARPRPLQEVAAKPLWENSGNAKANAKKARCLAGIGRRPWGISWETAKKASSGFGVPLASLLGSWPLCKVFV